MADRPIQAGDLVMFVRWTIHCPGSGGHYPTWRLGKIFTVGKIWEAGRWPCCGAPFGELRAQPNDGEWAACPLSWLKRLDPDALLDKTPTREEIEA